VGSGPPDSMGTSDTPTESIGFASSTEVEPPPPSGPSPIMPPLPPLPPDPVDGEPSYELPPVPAEPATHLPWLSPGALEQWEGLGQLESSTHWIFDLSRVRKQPVAFRQIRAATQSLALPRTTLVTKLVRIRILQSTVHLLDLGQPRAPGQRRWSRRGRAWRRCQSRPLQ